MKFALSFDDLDALRMGYIAKAEIYERGVMSCDSRSKYDDECAERWAACAEAMRHMARRWKITRDIKLGQLVLPVELPADAEVDPLATGSESPIERLSAYSAL